jgi:predicted RNA-binding Zn-ribbon protein involved in translation (DUF1610 family)
MTIINPEHTQEEIINNATVAIFSCPVPGCGGECHIARPNQGYTQIVCLACGYRGPVVYNDLSKAIAAHNALCTLVQCGNEAEAIERERDMLQKVVGKESLLANMYLQAGGDAADKRNMLRNAIEKIANRAEYLIEDGDLLNRTKTIRAIAKIARAALNELEKE